MNQPKLKVKWETIDYLLEELALAGLIALILVPAYYYFQLPDQIPVHFDVKGNPDAYGHKDTIWLLPLIGVLLYVFMTVINRYAHSFNYPRKITEENAYRQYKYGTRLVRILKTIITISFAYIVYASIRHAHGQLEGLGKYFLPFFLLLIFSSTGYYLYKSSYEQE